MCRFPRPRPRGTPLGGYENSPLAAGCPGSFFLDVKDVGLQLGILLEPFDELLEAALRAVAHVHETFHALHGEQSAREAHETSQRHVYRGVDHHLAVGGAARDEADAEGDQPVHEPAHGGDGDVAEAAIDVELASGVGDVVHHGRAVERGELFDGDDALLLAGLGEVVVIRGGSAVVGDGRGGGGGLDVDGAAQADVLRGRADQDVEIAALDVPILDEDVVVGECAAVQREDDLLFLARFEEHLFEAFEFLLGTEDAAHFVRDIELGDFRTVALADVLDLEGDGERLAFVDVGGGKFEVGVLELGVGKPETEGEEHGLFRRFVVAVAHIDALAVLHRARSHREVARDDVVAVLDGEGLGEFAGGIHLAVDDVVSTLAGRLSAEVEVEDGARVGQGVLKRDGRAAGEDDDDVGVDFGKSLDEHIVRVGHVHVLAVEALGLIFRSETDEHEDGVLALGDFLCLLDETGAVTVALHLVAGRVGIFLSRRVHGVEEGGELGGVDEAGAGTLIARSFGERADDRHLLRGGEGKDVPFVFEQHRAVCRHFRGEDVVRVEIRLHALVLFGFALEGELDHAQRDFVEVLDGERAVLHRFDDELVIRAAVAGHLKIHARFDAFHSVVHRAPIADDYALEAPFVAQDVGEHALVVGKESAVEAVVGTHHGGGLLRLDDMFEGGEIYLAQRSLVNEGVDAHPEMFLVVGAEVLQRDADARVLHAVHPRRAHAPRKERILREILEVPAAEGRAFNVDAGAEHRGDSESLCLGGDGFADGLDKFRIPGAGGSDRRRETGGGVGLFHDVCAAAALHLAPQPVRAVGHAHGRDAVFLNGGGGPESQTRAKGGFLFQSEFFQNGDIFVVRIFGNFCDILF